MLNGITWVLMLGYPFIVWFFMDTQQPRYLALPLAGLLLLRFLRGKQGPSWAGAWPMVVPACVLFLLTIVLTNQASWLLAYPIFVSILFFCVFSYSLVHPPTVVERLARLEDPELPPKGVDYTCKVTQVWCGFFLINAALSLTTVWYADRWLWSLYNGCIAYVLMGLLMAIEMTVRRKVKASF